MRSYRNWLRQRDAKQMIAEPEAWRKSAYRSYRDEINQYWNTHFGRSIHPLWHVACARATGIQDVRYISINEWWEDILPYYNSLDYRPVYRDKNLTDILLDCTRVPRVVFKRMHGHYYGPENGAISRREAQHLLSSESESLIVKPSQMDDGHGIGVLDIAGKDLLLNGNASSFSALESCYGNNFLVQERLAQHSILGEVHPHSVNTLRIATFRWQNDISTLMAFARFGVDKNLTDNAGTGGVCCGIDNEGRLHDTAVDLAGRVYDRHPTTDYAFEQRHVIPGFDEACQLVMDLHRQIFHFDIVSWDIVIRENGEPQLLEVNFQGMIHVYQFACRKPLFGELTAAVLEEVRTQRRT